MRAVKKFAPPPNMGSLTWANTYRWMSPEQTARPGKYRDAPTPWIKYMLEAMDDPKVRKIVCLKSAQAAWTDGAWNNFLFRRIHLAPCPVVLLFPKEKTIRKYRDQKFDPSIRATPALRELVDVSTSKSSGNRLDFVRFPGGFLALAASNAPDNIKSLSAPVVAVEEPDDCSDNVKGQGDSVALLEQRAKSFPDRKVIFGGTPTIKGHSRIAEEYRHSDQRVFMVPCHHCGESHVLRWEHVVCDVQPGRNHEIYGDYLPETAYYLAPCCGKPWTDKEKNRNVKKLYPVIQKPEVKDTVGFYINELYSPFDGSKLSVLMERYLKAQHKLNHGDESEMISFINNTCGEAYEYKDGSPDVKVIRERLEDYPELVVPYNGLMLTIGVDVQHDRLAIVIRAWGKGEESWLIWWGEILAKAGVSDVNDPVWDELDRIVFGRYPHVRFGSVPVTAMHIDSGDNTDAVYHYVRTRQGRGVNVRAIKGSNDLERAITTPPKKIDLSATTKASKLGLQVWIVGVEKGKDLVSERLKLTGSGSGRMHAYKDVRYDYPDQLLGESKIPSRKHGGKKKWTKRSGARVEALDCENYAMHGARTERIHLWSPERWDQFEAGLMQTDLLSGEDEGELITEIHCERTVEAEPIDIVVGDVAETVEPKQPQPPQPQPSKPKPKTRTFKPQTSTRNQTDRPNPPPTAAGKSVADQLAELGRRMGG